MDAVLRAASIYIFLLVIFRITGKRSLTEMTPFDLILLLIISETTQQAMLGDDFSTTNAVLVICTLIGFEVASSIITFRFPRLSPILEDAPLILYANGKFQKEHMKKERITEADILRAARTNQGIYRLDQIKYAILEKTGEVSILPFDDYL
ncbi:MAG TPA: YetF domain-containing protein [Thermomicrobiales bacterium]|nr:YetF domain-containing protein [Thermomicrobiales bacterium]